MQPRPHSLFRSLFVSLTVAGALAAGMSVAAEAPCWPGHVGLQLYSVRNEGRDAGERLDLVRSYGLTEVETAGTAGLSADAFAAALRDRALEPVAAHVDYGRMKTDLPGVIAEAKALGVRYVIVPSLSHKDGVFDAVAVAAEFESWGRQLRAAGLQFGYHNHGFEHVPMADGLTRFDQLMAGTTPENVCFEMDVFWVLHAGVDPVALLKKYPGRWRLMHVKDMRKGAPTGFHHGKAPATDKVVVGQGVIDWPVLLSTAEQAGVRHFFIEDETTAPRENIPASLTYLRALGAQVGGWIPLFDGKTLEGWKASESAGSFSVVDGQIVVHGARSHLFYVGPVANHDFRNFELSVEVMTLPGANSGVYFHTEWQETGWPAKGYEVQVNNSHSDKKRTAGLYNVKDNFAAVASDGKWFTLTIRVEGRRIVTSIDGQVITDFTEPENWQPPEGNPGRRLDHGTFALQGHDPKSEVHYRNLRVRVLP